MLWWLKIGPQSPTSYWATFKQCVPICRHKIFKLHLFHNWPSALPSTQQQKIFPRGQKIFQGMRKCRQETRNVSDGNNIFLRGAKLFPRDDKIFLRNSSWGALIPRINLPAPHLSSDHLLEPQHHLWNCWKVKNIPEWPENILRNIGLISHINLPAPHLPGDHLLERHLGSRLIPCWTERCSGGGG